MKRIITISLLLLLGACTQPAISSGMNAGLTDPSFIEVPSTPEETAIVQNELKAQRATRRSGHGFTYQKTGPHYGYWWWHY